MRIRARSIYLFMTALVFCGLALAKEAILIVYVTDADGKPVEGVVLSIEGDDSRSDPTDSAGIMRMALPKDTRPGDWIHLQLLKGAEGNENWILISPWNGRVLMPPFDGKPDSFVSVVAAKKFDKRMLANPKALRAMAESVLYELAPKTASETITEGQRRAVLEEVAKAYGLDPGDVDRAIGTWAEKAEAPYEIGLAALYARNYPLATGQLSRSLEIREGELERNKTEAANAAFFLGQSLYNEVRYQESANAYRKALALRPTDDMIINRLGVALTQAGILRAAWNDNFE
ncbi:MAG: hypothetical protein L0229_11255 [Blastocatellia bacterium]|nr:hypothetical protein [Blastocatellia bacterium]